ncbi:MAG: hypothetical protein SCALA702_30900 [Melioribacteraceae bacterium]|nr:MAG: hypothetical protein SCALA702_30900 [Melioribacteraceae bacterium]
MKPEKIKVVNKDTLHIVWDDGRAQDIKLMVLRRECPCAVCKSELEEESSSYIPVYTLEQLTVTNIKPVGFYGLSVIWKDGHNTGIYQYNDLYNMNGITD